MADEFDYLYETPDTGSLSINNDGKAERRKAPENDPTRPSLSGDYMGPGSKVKGIGGTEVALDHEPQAKATPVGGKAPGQHQMSPDELMAWANAEQAKYQAATQQAQMAHQSSVEPTLFRDQMVQPPPEWLAGYMDRQGQSPLGGVDLMNSGGYLLERERLKQLKALKAQR